MKCYVKDYPRPQFVRSDWENLNGVWDFAFDDGDVGESEKWYEDFKAERTINVPFTYETALSGIADETVHENIWYHRTLAADASKLKDNNYILNFEGSDFITKVWVNGKYAGSHKGGYTRFSFDLSNLLKDGENDLVIKVEDPLDQHIPRGKQRWVKQNFACWYVQTTGIWKTVWSEYVPKASISAVKMTPHLDEAILEVEMDVNAPKCAAGKLVAEAVVTFEGELVSRVTCEVPDNHIVMTLPMHLCNQKFPRATSVTWTPAKPNLYDLEFRLICDGKVTDKVGSYAAMREISIEDRKILLNGRPLYQKLLLDQGYWKDSHLTPPSEDALIEDIEKIQQLGYNGVRKHQKVEDERFLYWADVKGLLVWAETPAFYGFNDRAADEFSKEWMDIVRQEYNHPCVITWTAMNESWGIEEIATDIKQQLYTEGIYYLTKAYDPYRPVLVNDGWQHTVSDIITLHDYAPTGEALLEKYADLEEKLANNERFMSHGFAALAGDYEYEGQPVIISEYGGIAFNNDDSGWGYGKKENTEEDFIKRFAGLVDAIKELPGVCGYAYTQVTDVQQEINGLMDMDRNFKIAPEIIKEINDR